VRIVERVLRSRKLLATALGIIVTVCLLLALNSGGRAILQQNLADISGASPEVKPYVDLSYQVMPWERDLYERLDRLTRQDLGLELSKEWGASVREADVTAWIAKMRIYTNFLDVFGFLFYFPTPMWFRVAWDLYGEISLILTAILLATSYTKNIHFRYVAMIAIAGLAVLGSLVSAPCGQSVNGGDVIRNPASWNFHEWYLRQSIVKWGEIPLWYRYRYGGAPYLGDPQMIIFYPTTILLALSPNEMIGIRYAIVLHVILSGISMYFLMNVWKQSPEASLVAGLGYMLGGYTFAKIWAGHLTFIYPNMWIPLVLAFTELSFRRRSPKYAALAGLSLAMQVQSGVIMALYTAILLGLYGLFKIGMTIVRHIRRPIELLRNTGETAKFVAIFAVFAFLFSASKILPTLEVLPYIDRGVPLDEGEQLKGVIPDLSYLIQVFTFRPNPTSEDLNGPSGLPYLWSEYWCYAGALLPLAICSLRFVRQNKLVIFLLAATAASALWSMGILYQLLQAVPFISFTRVPSRLLILSQFALSALAGITVTNIQDWFAKGSDSMYRHRSLGRLRLDRLFALLMAIIVFADLATAGAAFVRTVDVRPTGGAIPEKFFPPFHYGPSPSMKQIVQDSRGDTFRVYKVEGMNAYAYSVNGLETSYRGDTGWEFSINAYSKYHRLAKKQGSYKMMGMLNIKYVISDKPQETSSDLKLVSSFGEEEFLYYNRHFMNRIEFVEHGLLVVTPDGRLWESVSTSTILRDAFNPASLSIVHGGYLDEFTPDELRRFSAIQIADQSDTPAFNPSRARELLDEYVNGGGTIIQTTETPDSILQKLGSKSKSSQVSITRYTPNILEATVTAASRGFAVISETYIPGWRIYVDGREVRLLQINDIFIGVPLDAGMHKLRVEFRPEYYDLGVVLTILGCIGVATLHFTKKATLYRLTFLDKKAAYALIALITAYAVFAWKQVKKIVTRGQPAHSSDRFEDSDLRGWLGV